MSMYLTDCLRAKPLLTQALLALHETTPVQTHTPIAMDTFRADPEVQFAGCATVANMARENRLRFGGALHTHMIICCICVPHMRGSAISPLLMWCGVVW